MQQPPHMQSLADQFASASRLKVEDAKHRRTINFNMARYDAAVAQGLNQYVNHDLARRQASYIKSQAINNLEKYLVQFERKAQENGITVLWARDGAEALKLVNRIMQQHRARMVVKSKSMTTEEIHLNDFLAREGVEPVETDLGEYIVQLAGQKPYHIVTPAMHMSKEDISELFVQKLKIEPTTDPQKLTLVARNLLREKYTTADVGISGANFIIADIGGIALTENEGNARLSVTFPRVHIAIAGIEKVIPSMEDLQVMWPILATHGTGQQVTVYNTIITGPRAGREIDGPDEMFVILLDNGRTTLLKDPEKRAALKCIRCGACLNACPVYRNIGGHTYASTYSGPIGSVITPHYDGMKQFKHLSYASSLCGACTSVCPVRIPIHELLLLNRHQSVKEGLALRAERIGFAVWKQAMKHRMLMNFGPANLKNKAINNLFKESWGAHRAPIKLAPKSFNELWKERKKAK